MLRVWHLLMNKKVEEKFWRFRAGVNVIPAELYPNGKTFPTTTWGLMKLGGEFTG